MLRQPFCLAAVLRAASRQTSHTLMRPTSDRQSTNAGQFNREHIKSSTRERTIRAAGKRHKACHSKGKRPTASQQGKT